MLSLPPFLVDHNDFNTPTSTCSAHIQYVEDHLLYLRLKKGDEEDRNGYHAAGTFPVQPSPVDGTRTSSGDPRFCDAQGSAGAAVCGAYPPCDLEAASSEHSTGMTPR